ncbi:hypothetical protein [Methylobacterium sp. 77]|uniref:hypothetical protein n=1 Tax=Methylobacterium sp. 77 TaxID=1101192 RepID=UPI0012DED654|nr:hypothetical protein [Methylobacterium sp. 77]
MNRPVLKQVAIYSTVSTLVILSVIAYYLDSTLIFPERMLTALPARLVFPIEVIFLPELDSSIYAKQIGLFYLGTVTIFSILCFARVYVSPDDINASINDGYIEYQRLHTKVLFIGIYMRFQSIYFLFVFDSN